MWFFETYVSRGTWQVQLCNYIEALNKTQMSDPETLGHLMYMYLHVIAVVMGGTLGTPNF